MPRKGLLEDENSHHYEMKTISIILAAMKTIAAILAVTLIACNTPEAEIPSLSLEVLNSKIKQDSSDLQKYRQHMKWETNLKVKLMDEGIIGDSADHYVDSISAQMFAGSPPAWYVKYRLGTNETSPR